MKLPNRDSKRGSIAALIILGTLIIPAVCAGQDKELDASVENIVRDVLAGTGVPSASVAIVRDGQIVLTQAYGNARVSPAIAARPNMRYSIGSISKQFTAAALLMLQEQRRISLEDPVDRYVPGLTRGNEVTIRMLLSHTSGYQDFWPQDYVFPMILQSATPEKIMDIWARKPLDFDPGTRWQYSNTNYVIAGAIFEKAAGVPIFEFLRQKVFDPLAMKSVLNIDQEQLTPADATGYMRYAIGPLRVAPNVGKGWLFAAGELAMTAEDLARWDIAVLGRKLLTPDSYRQLETEFLLKNGAATGYGLGLDKAFRNGRRVLEHTGEVSGFTAANVVFPDDGSAIVVLTNEDAVHACSDIAQRIEAVLWRRLDAPTHKAVQRAGEVLESLQRGKLNRAWLTENANSYFTDQAIADFASSLKPLGTPTSISEEAHELRGGMLFRRFRVNFPTRILGLTTFEVPDGRLEQFMIAPE